MNEKEQTILNHLMTKIDQQEKAIVQLVEIVAATNRKITDLAIQQKESGNQYLLS